MAQSGARRKRENVIDESLKRVYEEAIEEGVPDRFRLLLEELKKQEQDRSSSK
mgnify:CR=1 FL=1